MATLNNDIVVNISDGGIGRLASGKDYYTGMIFQSATKPAEFGTDDIKRVYSLAQAETLGLTAADFPVENYHISEYFRVARKFNKNIFLDIYMADIGTGTFDGSEIEELSRNSNYELRQIGVYLTDTFAETMVTACDTVAGELNDLGYPTGVVLAADFANFTAPSDLRALDKKWCWGVCIGQDGGGTGAALFASEGNSITCIGAMMGTIASAKVSKNIGEVESFDVSGITELQTLALCDGTLVSELTPAQIDNLNDKGYTLLVKRRVAGSYFYDDPTAADETSDFFSVSNMRTISKAKRSLLERLAILQNMELFVNATTGQLTEQTIGRFTERCTLALNELAANREIQVDPDTGRIPSDAISINPNQNVITTSKVNIIARVQPIGINRETEVDLGFTVKTN